MPSVAIHPLPSPSGRRERRKRVTRQDLIVAGRRLFSRRGLYDARIEDLARGAGVAKGTVYGYFGCKEELIEAVVRAGLADLTTAVRQRAADLRGRARDTELILAHVDFLSEHPDMLRVFHQARGLLKFRRLRWRALRLIFHEHLDAMDAVLGGPGAKRPRGAGRGHRRASLVFGAISGVASMHAILGEWPLPAAERRAVARAIMGLLAAHRRPSSTRPRARVRPRARR